MDNNSDYKRAEAILYNYPILEAKIKNLELELDELLEYDVLPASSNDIKPGSATNAISNTIENEVIKRDDNEKAKSLKKKIKKLQRQKQKIENALEALSEEQREIVRLKYFKQRSIGWICNELDIHEVTLSRKRKEIIEKYIIPLMVKGD